MMPAGKRNKRAEILWVDVTNDDGTRTKELIVEKRYWVNLKFASTPTEREIARTFSASTGYIITLPHDTEIDRTRLLRIDNLTYSVQGVVHAEDNSETVLYCTQLTP